MYDHNCHICGSPFQATAQTVKFCGEECRAEGRRARNRACYYRTNPRPKTDGPLLRLEDVPTEKRLKAFRDLVDSGELSADEIPLAFAAALEPGDLGALAA